LINVFKQQTEHGKHSIASATPLSCTMMMSKAEETSGWPLDVFSSLLLLWWWWTSMS